MRLTKIEKIDIINTVIDIWGTINANQLDILPIELSLIGRDKYGISLRIDEYHSNHVIVISFTDKNILGQEKMYYHDLPDYIIDEILSALIRYDEKQIRS